MKEWNERWVLRGLQDSLTLGKHWSGGSVEGSIIRVATFTTAFESDERKIESLRIYVTSTEVECEQVELEFLVHYKDGTESSLCGNGVMFWDSPYRSLKKTFEDPSIKFENPPRARLVPDEHDVR